MDNRRVRWSDLPPQLWQVIGERLDTYIDVLRFRSVCRSWRASLPQLSAVSPLFPLLVPYPFAHQHHPVDDVLVVRRIIYCLTPLDSSSSASSSSSAAAAAAKGWLAKIESSKLGKMRFLRPLCTHSVKSRDEVFLKEVSLLDFRIQEVAKSYMLECIDGSIGPAISKVVVFPDSSWIDLKNSTIVAVHLGGMLMFTKPGDSQWTPFGNDQKFLYRDLIVYKGQIYTVDRHGAVFLIDSSMKLVQFSPPLPGSGSSNAKHLVECGGELHVVERFLEKVPSDKVGWISWSIDSITPKVVDFKVHRLDQKRGRWVEVQNLGNQAFVLGHDCFSVSAPDLEGFKGNCIYFSHEINSNVGYGYSTHVLDLEDRSIREASAQVFKAPPIWLDLEATGFQSQPSNDSLHKRWIRFRTELLNSMVFLFL